MKQRLFALTMAVLLLCAGCGGRSLDMKASEGYGGDMSASSTWTDPAPGAAMNEMNNCPTTHYIWGAAPSKWTAPSIKTPEQS